MGRVFGQDKGKEEVDIDQQHLPCFSNLSRRLRAVDEWVIDIHSQHVIFIIRNHDIHPQTTQIPVNCSPSHWDYNEKI
jgi:hypothetical protein